jgi:hypothetical protein
MTFFPARKTYKGNVRRADRGFARKHEPVKLKLENLAQLSKDEADAHAFMVHMNLGLQNEPHWRLAR